MGASETVTPRDLGLTIGHEDSPDALELTFATLEEVRLRILRLREHPPAAFSLTEDEGQAHWVSRLFGVRRSVRSHFAIECNQDFACLIFHDDAWSEYRALKPDDAPEAPASVREHLSMGGGGRAPVDEVIPLTTAFAAIDEYLVREERPPTLSYRYVK